MAKVSMIERDKKRSNLSKKYAKKYAELKAVVSNREISLEERFDAQLKLAKLPRNSSKVRYRNRCECTGRPRGYYRKFRISRIALRELASLGLLPGVVKSSW
jgi:small subunit ribosomal protein S14